MFSHHFHTLLASPLCLTCNKGNTNSFGKRFPEVLITENFFWSQYLLSRTVVLKLFVAADPFHCTQNRFGPLSFVNDFLIAVLINYVWSFLSVCPPRSKFHVSACR